MKINTKYFGEMEVDKAKIIFFPHGLVAFHELKEYCLVESGSEKVPFCWLQAVDRPDLAFVLINPFLFKPDYDFELSAEHEEELGIEQAEDVAVFSIVVLPGEIEKMSANLLAPVVINTRTRKGKQVVLQDPRYSTRHYILEEMHKSRGGEGAGDNAGTDEKKR